MTPIDFTVPCPIPMRVSRGQHRFCIPTEEAFTFWLWVWPAMLGWRREPLWLFSPVVGRTHYPGDLWGLDADGELLIVETKIDRARGTLDPFEDFVGLDTAGNDLREEVLKDRWKRLLKNEFEFWNLHYKAFIAHREPDGRYPGVLPYSSHRHAIWHWPDLYREVIVPKLKAPSYCAQVEEAFRARARRRNPSPHFFGVLGNVRDTGPRLSKRGAIRRAELVDAVGDDHVHLRVVRADFRLAPKAP